jgi:hypothetical protein
MKKDQTKHLLKEALNASEAKRKNPYNKKSSLSPILIILIACLVLVAVQYGVSLKSSEPITGSWGKIISPIAGTTTGTEISVTAETKNLEPGQYVWLVVDKPGIGICWPKIQVKANTHFKTSIKEEGLKGSPLNYIVFLKGYLYNRNRS